MKKVVIIAGMHRSGTSVAAQLCQHMGAYLGEKAELMGAARDNPGGFFENIEITKTNDEILRLCGREWYSLTLAEPDYHHPQIIKKIEKLKAIVQRLLLKSDTVAIKDPRISVLLPLWEKILDGLEVETAYIWIFRNPLEVMESLRKRDGYTSKHSLLLWSHYNLSILRFLRNKKYLLVDYREILDNSKVFESFSQIFGRKPDNGLKQEFNQIVTHAYCHSHYSCEDVRNTQEKFLIDLYEILVTRQERKADLPELEEQYRKEIVIPQKKYMDYAVLEDRESLRDKEIIIYGAGNYGKRIAKMLRDLGITRYDFCDRDAGKRHMEWMGGIVFSIAEIENKENVLFIIAVENADMRREIEQTLMYAGGGFSAFATELIWKYTINKPVDIESDAERFTLWYRELKMRGDVVKNACRYPILVYQNGKVGSSTIVKSLWNEGVKNAHVHRFFFKNDMIGELILGENHEELIKNTNVFSSHFPGYVDSIKNRMKGKKIITMIREPIATDLSTVFQWIGSGVADRFFAERLRKGKTFLQAVSELMGKIQNRLFEWFEEELRELCGVNVLDYPFDKEKGYTIISSDNAEILLFKIEKITELENVIRDFAGVSEFELQNDNVGERKEYAHIYKEVKKRMKLPAEYIEYYYCNHPYMEHFYSKEEQEIFLRKWNQ